MENTFVSEVAISGRAQSRFKEQCRYLGCAGIPTSCVEEFVAAHRRKLTAFPLKADCGRASGTYCSCAQKRISKIRENLDWFDVKTLLCLLLSGKAPQTTGLRPVIRLISATTSAITSNKWIRDPATWNPHPNSQRMIRIAKMVQSIGHPHYRTVFNASEL